ncbi:cytochrome P450 [Scleroderma yunnanense]
MDASPVVLATSFLGTPLSVLAFLAIIWVLRVSVRAALRRFKTTKLLGPPRTNLIFGVSKNILDSSDAGFIYEEWAKRYGSVYQVPTTLGGKRIMLCDTKAIAHYCARETWTYVLPSVTRHFFLRQLGRGILWAQGETHKRQRKSLTPAFSNHAIRNLTPIFYNSAYKMKAVWESLIDVNDGDNAIIEVQTWLDTMGLAGFSHDFGSIDGKSSAVAKMFDSLGASSKRSALNSSLFLLSQVFPILAYVPTPRNKLLNELQETMEEIATILLERTKKAEDAGVLGESEEKSIIGVLLKAKDTDNTRIHLFVEEVLAQMKVLLVAGYETTSSKFSPALLELARYPDIQSKLRQELVAFGVDPTYDQLTNGLPYLDAVVHETLRLHPPVSEFVRVAVEDDVIPLAQPVRIKSGEVVHNISVARGTKIGINAACINRSEALWGLDAKIFLPERWLAEGGIPKEVQEVQGYRHLLTFMDGQRACLGKGFAVTEFKAVLSVLVKNFVFEMRDGPDTQVEMGRGMLPRPKLAGEEGTQVPLRVSRHNG